MRGAISIVECGGSVVEIARRQQIAATERAKVTLSPLRKSVKATRALSLGSSRKTRRCVVPFPDIASDSITGGF
jgi:hypothetical protein